MWKEIVKHVPSTSADNKPKCRDECKNWMAHWKKHSGYDDAKTGIYKLFVWILCSQSVILNMY